MIAKAVTLSLSRHKSNLVLSLYSKGIIKTRKKARTQESQEDHHQEGRQEGRQEGQEGRQEGRRQEGRRPQGVITYGE